jgi:hypothetical protein
VSLAIAALSIAGIVAVGHALRSVMVRQTTLYWFERWAFAYLAGMGALSAFWLAFGPVLRTTGPISLYVVCLIAAIFAYVRRGAGEAPGRQRLHRLDVVLAVMIAIECAAVTLVSLRSPLGFDGLFNFEMKARLMFEHPSGRLPIEYLSDASRNWSHPQYPLLVPFGELWVYTWLGRVDQSAVKILFPMFYLCLTAFVCGAVRRVSGMRASLVAGVALGVMPPLTLLPGASSGYADVPLAAAIAGAVNLGAIALRTGNTDAMTLGGALAGIATWTKTEGLVLSGCVAGLGFVLLHVSPLAAARPSLRESSPLVWIPLVAALPWLLIQGSYGIPAPDFLAISPPNLLGSARRLPEILDLTTRELFRPGHWGLIWPAWLIAVIVIARRGRSDRSDLFLIGAVILPLVLYIVPFVFSAWPDTGEHVRSALPRLLVPLAPLALVLTTTTLWREWESGRI